MAGAWPWVPERVLRLAVQTRVGLENEDTLGSPIAQDWLRACVAFYETAPWRAFSIRQPLTGTFTKAPHDTRVLAVGGSAVAEFTRVLWVMQSASRMAPQFIPSCCACANRSCAHLDR